MGHKPRLAYVLCTVLVVSAMPLRAAGTEEATEAFNALYGEDLKRVRATGDARDDVKLARRLLAGAKKATGQPALLAILCEKAADLAGPHPDGVATTIAAMEFLMSQVPERAAACADRAEVEDDKARIRVGLDGRSIIDWRGEQSDLAPLNGWDVPQEGCLGLGANGAIITWSSIRLRMLSGEARLLRPPRKSQPRLRLQAPRVRPSCLVPGPGDRPLLIPATAVYVRV